MKTWTPRKTAISFGIAANQNVRRPLRERDTDRAAHTTWHLDRDDIEFVGQWNVDRGNLSANNVSEVLHMFDNEQENEPSRGHEAFEVEPPEFDVIDHEGPVRREGERLLRMARSGGSILTDHDVWTKENIEAIVECFVKQPDVTGQGFFTKLDIQLAGVRDDVRVLFAEIFLLQMLPISQFRMDTKIGNIDRVLRDIDVEYSIPAEVLEALGSPIFGGGVAFAIRRFQQLSMLIEFVRYIRSLSEDEWEDTLESPLAWRDAVASSPGSPEPSLRASLTYLGHPEYFFPIVSEHHKGRIVDSFFPEITKRAATGDSDVDLAALREWMSPEPGTTPNFYDDPLASYWMGYEDDDEAISDDDLPKTPEYSIESIIEDGAFHPHDELRSIVTRWKATKNVVLQGPPGTGKTWLARRLAFALIGLELGEAVRSVQFHPGTSYEDFIRGWRPGGDGKLTLVDGPLLQHAARAREHPDIEHVLIIEEFNRGNPAQSLGEMLTLLESTKRNDRDSLELTYTREGEQGFSLPDNLYVVGTMNTADRSLALVDFALRRRFAFFNLAPQLNDSWKKHLKDRFRNEPRDHIDEAASRVIAMNDEIAADPALGPSFRIGHSYFTPEKEASEFGPWFRAVVESSVGPQLMEYWHDDPETADRIVKQLLAGF